MSDQTKSDDIELAFPKVEPPIDGREIGPEWWFRKGAEWAREQVRIEKRNGWALER